MDISLLTGQALHMPSIEWNRKWQRMIAEFESSDEEVDFGNRWGDPRKFRPLTLVRRRFIDPYFRPGQTVLEIGSGGGRFTQFLLQAQRIIVVELNPASFDYLRQRFPQHAETFHYYETTGYEMGGVSDAVVDFAFSFDVFVHIEPQGILDYLKEIERVLKPGGTAVVHYGDIEKKIARDNPGFSRMTQSRMLELVAQSGLRVAGHDTSIMFHSNLMALRKERCGRFASCRSARNVRAAVSLASQDVREALAGQRVLMADQSAWAGGMLRWRAALQGLGNKTLYAVQDVDVPWVQKGRREVEIVRAWSSYYSLACKYPWSFSAPA
ncbi:MAG: class I SAM-dependent methyltransferase, partial [Acidobacteriota bacterium]